MTSSFAASDRTESAPVRANPINGRAAGKMMGIARKGALHPSYTPPSSGRSERLMRVTIASQARCSRCG
jgi:hypothetical protein